MLLSLAAFAQVAPIGPFSGEFSEGFESFPLTTAALPCLNGAFSGQAEICAAEANVGGMQVRDELFLGACLQQPYAGGKLAGSNDGLVEFVFDDPIRRFGGRFSTHAATAGSVLIEFFDAEGIEIDSVTEPIGSCSWDWRGYESVGDIAIHSVRVRHTLNAGALANLDGLAIDTLCGVGAPDADGDGSPSCVDCDDNDAGVRPGAVDSCNGIDDDCNGVVDDGSEPAPLATQQDGVCAGSLQICSAGAWADPDYAELTNYEAVEIRCDGLDNDCNGAEDDGLESPSVGPEFGVCLELVATCAGSEGWLEPDATEWANLVGYEADESTCDGVDSDCDGEIDDGLDAPPADLQDGVCEGAVQVCAGDGGFEEPDYATLDGYDTTEICDELDNDCDGEVDEDCVKAEGDKLCATAPGSFAALVFTLLAFRRRHA